MIRQIGPRSGWEIFKKQYLKDNNVDVIKCGNHEFVPGACDGKLRKGYLLSREREREEPLWCY